MLQTTLKRRLVWLLLQSFVLSLAAVAFLGVVGQRALRRETDRQRLDAARLMASAIDRELSLAAQDLARLADDLEQQDRSPVSRLRQYRFHSLFRSSVSLIEGSGEVIVSDPPGAHQPGSQVWTAVEGITPVYGGEAGEPASIALVHPVRRNGERRYLVAEMILDNSTLGDRLTEMAGGDDRHVALVDETGTILAVNDELYLLQRLSHRDEIAGGIAGREPVVWHADNSPMCPEEPQPVLTVMIPLLGPHWGLVLQEHRVTAYAASAWIRRGALLAGFVLAGAGVFLATTLSRSIVTPLNALANQATRMKEGNLATPVVPRGDREIRLLGEAFEAMRERLHATLARLEAFNVSLEAEVVSRTKRLAERDAERRVLVRKLLGAGEDERCRIARELHDETAQMLTAVQLVLDEQPVPDLERARHLLVETQREIHRVIYDLRPSLLDDLGLRAAIRSHAETYLRPNGIEVSLEVDDLPPLDTAIEISIFRVYQELATNVLRHSRAEHVSVELYTGDGRLFLAVEDDGVGFDPAARRTGAGITGMRERVELVGGVIKVDSEPGMGTHVVVEVPLQT